VDEAREQVGALAVDLPQQRLRARRDVRIGVDLAVRVLQSDADLLAAVLEGEHLLHAGQRAQMRRPVGPRLDDGPRASHALRAEASRALGAEAHDLTTADGGARAADPRGDEVFEVTRRVLGSGSVLRRA